MNNFGQMNNINMMNNMNEINNMNMMNNMNGMNNMNIINNMNNMNNINMMNNMNNINMMNNMNGINDMNNMKMNILNNMNWMYKNDMPNLENYQMQAQIQQQNILNQGPMMNMFNNSKNNLINQNQQKKIYKNKKILREEPTKIELIRSIENNISNIELHLFCFFELVSIDLERCKIFYDALLEGAINVDKNNPRLYINYYNIVKAEVYINISLKIYEIIPQIFGQIFYPYLTKKIYKRTNQKQTTEFVILNPIKVINHEKTPFIYQNFLYFEFKGKNLSKYNGMTGKELGLKQNDELSLKLYPEFDNEIKEFPKNKRNIWIKFSSEIFGMFISSIKGMSLNNFLKIFNSNKFIILQLISFPENINELTSLNLYLKKDIKGGGIYDGLFFMDPSNSSIKLLELSKNAPKWRIISTGLNLFGICQNKKCQAYEKEVIFRTCLPENGMIFDMVENCNTIKCPICSKIFTPTTCGFYKCEYQFIGEKLEDGEQNHFESIPKETKGDNVEYYQPTKGKEARWFKLKIYVLPIQGIKYKP